MIAADVAPQVPDCRVPRMQHEHHCSCKQRLPDQYRRTGVGSFLADWLPVVWSNIGWTKVRRFVRIWSMHNRVEYEGLEHLPTDGLFVLAANHIHGAGMVTSLIGAILSAVSKKRPDVVDEMQLLIGTRQARQNLPWYQRVGRAAWEWTKDRWSDNLVQMPMSGEKPSTKQLFQWRRRTASRPSMLLPEGIGRPLFSEVRDGCGGMLKLTPHPTIPVAVFFQTGVYRVRFGEPIAWSQRNELLDVQLGLAIAQLLPEELLDQQWRNILTRIGGLDESATAQG